MDLQSRGLLHHAICPSSHDFHKLEILMKHLLPSQTRRSFAEISIRDRLGSSMSPSGKCFLCPRWLLRFLWYSMRFSRDMLFLILIQVLVSMMPRCIFLPWTYLQRLLIGSFWEGHYLTHNGDLLFPLSLTPFFSFLHPFSDMIFSSIVLFCLVNFALLICTYLSPINLSFSIWHRDQKLLIKVTSLSMDICYLSYQYQWCLFHNYSQIS